MFRAFKFRLYPNKSQTAALAEMLETHRRLYNTCLYFRSMAWELYGVGIDFYEQRSWFIRQWRKHPQWCKLNAISAHETIWRLDKAFQSFFRRVKNGETPGYPKFKGRGCFTSIMFGTYPQGLRPDVGEGKVYVHHIGEISAIFHREIVGKIKTAGIVAQADKWYVVLFCDIGPSAAPPSSNPEVGIDVGLTSFFTTSDGATELNPRYLSNELRRLRVLGRSVSRKKKGGANRQKAVKQLRNLHARVKALRNEHHHKTALRLVRRYGLIAVENLQVANLVKNNKLARAITILKQKAEAHGVRVVEVDPRGTSQACSQCGKDVPKDLSVRQHDCPHCEVSIDRDVNAAKNILARAKMQARIEPLGVNVGHKVKRCPRKTKPRPALKSA